MVYPFTRLFGTIAFLSFGVVFLGGAAAARAETLKEQIVGSWEITSISNQYDDGKRISPFGAGGMGRYVFGKNGLFSETIIGEPRAELKSDDPRHPDAFVVVNLGHYTVDEAKKEIFYKIEHAGYSARNGSERTLTATVNGNTATFITAKIKDKIGTFSFEAAAKRVE